MFIVCHSLFTSVNSIRVEITSTLSPNNNPGLMINKPYFSTFKKNLWNKKEQKQKYFLYNREHPPSFLVFNHWNPFVNPFLPTVEFFETLSHGNNSSRKHLYIFWLIANPVGNYQLLCNLLLHVKSLFMLTVYYLWLIYYHCHYSCYSYYYYYWLLYL